MIMPPWKIISIAAVLCVVCHWRYANGATCNAETDYNCCGGQTYDRSLREFCCAGQIYRYGNGTGCCGNQTYNYDSHWCCAGVIQPKARYVFCCGQETYNYSTQMCCGNLVRPKDSNGCCGRINSWTRQRCCGETTYNTSSHTCCGYTVQPTLGWYGGCCGTKAYDYRNQTCCEGEVWPGGRATSAARARSTLAKHTAAAPAGSTQWDGLTPPAVATRPTTPPPTPAATTSCTQGEEVRVLRGRGVPHQEGGVLPGDRQRHGPQPPVLRNAGLQQGHPVMLRQLGQAGRNGSRLLWERSLQL